MAKQLQIRGGTTVQHSTFTGALREITIDTDKDVVVVHDGTTVGGFPLAKQTSVDSKVTKVTSTDNAVVRFDGATGQVQNSGVIIDDNSNVGIGTNSPLSKCHIKGTTPQLFLEDSNGGTNGKFMAIGTDNGVLKFSRYLDNGTLDGEKIRIDSLGNLLLTSGTGGLGYGTGAGGQVIQLTSKSTAVTLNKPCGTIVTSSSALAAGATVGFYMYNTLAAYFDVCVIETSSGNYNVSSITENGDVYIRLTNITATTLSEAVVIRFALIKGASA